MQKSTATALMLATLLICSTIAWSGEQKSTVPNQGSYNVIFMMTDQERYFETAPIGTNWRARALLASIGAAFEKHSICSNLSTSSRSVVYTGQHITKTKMVDNADMPWQGALDENIITVGHRLRKAGYYTAYKGKFHMLDEGAIDIPGSGSKGEKKNLQQQDGLEHYGFSDWNREGDIAGSTLQGYRSDEYIKGDAVRWLRDKGSALNESGQPFFLAVNFVNPHDIMFYNPTGRKTVLNTNAAPKNAIYAQTYGYAPSTWDHAPWGKGGIPAHREYRNLWNAVSGDLPQEQAAVEKFNDYYLNCIHDQDNVLMSLLEELKRLGMMDNTIIILTSDHGEMGGAHGLKGKGNFLYEENLHVPFIVYHPAYKGGRRINAVTSHLDIAPTIMDMAGVAARDGLVGHSLLPLLRGQADSVRNGALFVFGMVSLIDADYKPLSGGTDLDMTKR
ncbi:MAG: sulfatase-like hydrolase/transferase, partial [Oscillospiraceae bacterium]|nr:sulfatase-like hydrolase/transferase [Oscillospiraceae bacterium]